MMKHLDSETAEQEKRLECMEEEYKEQVEALEKRYKVGVKVFWEWVGSTPRHCNTPSKFPTFHFLQCSLKIFQDIYALLVTFVMPTAS